MKSFRKLFFLLFISIISLDIYSQSATCAIATSLTVNGACGSGNINSAVNTAGSPSCLSGGTFRREGWYSFTVTGGPSDIEITASASNRNLLVQVFSGTCVSLTEIGCENSNTNNNSSQTESLSLNNLANGTYRIRVLNVGNNNDMTLTSICVCSHPVPSCATLNTPANNSSVCPIPQTLSWTALAAPACGSITYDVYFNAGTTATALVSSDQVGTTYATGALINGTTYAWRIVPRNGTKLATGCATFTFVTYPTASSTAP